MNDSNSKADKNKTSRNTILSATRSKDEIRTTSQKKNFTPTKHKRYKKKVFKGKYKKNFKKNENLTSQTYDKSLEKKPSNKFSQDRSKSYSRNIVLPNQMISVVIPLYNEEGSLNELSAALKKVFGSLKCNYEVIFIDDGSTDQSFSILKGIHSRNYRFRCIKLRRNYGKSSALAAGFKMAKGDIIITMDADLQDDPEEIPELIQKINYGYDLVSGWKKIRYDPFIKKHTSKLFNFITSKISGIKLHDFNCGLKAYKKDVIKSIKVYGEMHRYMPALAYLSGFKVTEKVVKHRARKYGETKFGASRFLKGFFDLLTVIFTTKYIKRPLHLFGTVGVISFLVGFVITLFLTYLKFFKNQYISDRPLFLVGVLFMIVGIQFLSLGLIAEMITKANVHEDDALIELTL